MTSPAVASMVSMQLGPDAERTKGILRKLATNVVKLERQVDEMQSGKDANLPPIKEITTGELLSLDQIHDALMNIPKPTPIKVQEVIPSVTETEEKENPAGLKVDKTGMDLAKILNMHQEKLTSFVQQALSQQTKFMD